MTSASTTGRDRDFVGVDRFGFGFGFLGITSTLRFWVVRVNRLRPLDVTTRLSTMPSMRIHRLKTLPSYFAALKIGDKTFEVRRNDRDFAVGDRLVLCEYDPSDNAETFYDGHYSGHELTYDVTYVMHGGRFGLDGDYVVMGIRPVGAP